MNSFTGVSTSAQQTQESLLAQYVKIRSHTLAICAPLETEDYVVQPTADVSPPKWHLAHTTWFFEELLLLPLFANYQRFNDNFPALFNSYYKSAGTHWLQSERGQLSRPTVSEVMAYRQHVDSAMQTLLEKTALSAEALSHLEIGLHHEQQHQELLLMDIKYILAANPCAPAYSPSSATPMPSKGGTPVSTRAWHSINAGNVEIGHTGNGFGFDNEFPRHTGYQRAAKICETLVSNADYLTFIEAGGYERPEYWLSMGWDWLQQNAIAHPLYWLREGDAWQEFTLRGKSPLNPELPVAHISYFEASAFAAWSGFRLPTEQEMEIFLNHQYTDESNARKVERGYKSGNAPAGQLWCWTSSAYAAYPGYTPYEGMLGEYNGKFMCNQYVLRGGCIATPKGHFRPSYRNFYLPHQRWMFSGIRLAKDI